MYANNWDSSYCAFAWKCYACLTLYYKIIFAITWICDYYLHSYVNFSTVQLDENKVARKL